MQTTSTTEQIRSRIAERRTGDITPEWLHSPDDGVHRRSIAQRRSIDPLNVLFVVLTVMIFGSMPVAMFILTPR